MGRETQLAGVVVVGGRWVEGKEERGMTENGSRSLVTVGEMRGEVDGMGAGEDLNLVVKEERSSRVGKGFINNLRAAVTRQWMATYGNSMVMNQQRRAPRLPQCLPTCCDSQRMGKHSLKKHQEALEFPMAHPPCIVYH